MGINSFWLFYIEGDSILVALINWGNGRFYVASIGPRVAFDIDDHQSVTKAADQSLSSAAISADISPEQEPLFVGLVIPSDWVDEDGKITKSKSEIILPLLKNLDLKPSGFMSNDEAIIEEASKPDDFPASFINLYLETNYFELSLVYLGKIKNRIRKKIDSEFSAQLVEDTLVEFNSESALPPQIYIYGKADESTVEELKNFPWVGKKNVETFLHFPDIKLYRDEDLVNIFFKAITAQMIGGGNPAHQTVTSVSPSEPKIETIDEVEEAQDTEIKDETIDDNLNIPEDEIVDSLEEVSPDDLGFTDEIPIPAPLIETAPPVSETPNFEFINPSATPKKQLPKIDFKLPQLPQFKLKFNPLFLILPITVVFIFLIFFSKATITLYLTPYEFNKTVDVTLDSDASDISSSVIPVDKKNVDVSSSVTVKTTGQKTVGTKATGEITIFNKLEKVQNIPKGSVLVDANGHTFQLINSVQAAASVTNYETGTMNFGQVKTSISASDIGPEFNITKDATLTFKDFPQTSIVVKASSDFAGGTKKQVQTVSKQDQTDAQSQLTEKLSSAANKKITEELKNSSDILQETIQVKTGKVEFNREVDEETDNLTATAQSTVSVFVINSEIKEKILKQFLSQETGFSESEINPDSFKFSLKIDKLDTSQAFCSLTIKGSSLPKIDANSIKKSIAGKTIKNAQSIIKKTISRVYDFNFQSNFNFLNLLPFNTQNITINTETESK